MIKTNCDFCKKEIKKKLSQIKLYKHHFCSYECNCKFKIGRIMSKEFKKKMSKIAKERFSIPENNPFYGKKHSIKTKIHLSIAHKGKLTGSGSHRWKGGRLLTKDGYIYVIAKDHPFATKGYILEHRLIMEKKIGRYLKSQEIVHHINSNPSDNRIKNLMLFPDIFSHRKHHINISRE